MALLRGVIGGAIKAFSGLYLIYYMGFFEDLKDTVNRAEEYLLASSSLSDVYSASRQVFSDFYSHVASNLEMLLLLFIAWHIGGRLVDSAWGRLKRLWPGWVRVAYRFIDLAFNAMALIAFIYPLYRFMASLRSNVLTELGLPEGMLESFDLFRLLPLLYVLPLTLPIIKGLITLKYSEARASKVGVLLLVAGGVFYLYSAYHIYAAFSPLHAIVEEGERLQGVELDIINVKGFVSIAFDSINIMVSRMEGFVRALAIASILYTAGFLLFREKTSIIVGFKRTFKL
ncbi:MAG: hypothetical protein GSR85_11945 [Desulfurococcales archaeon]|nr:hypothetical protein [Desulfurococcales archaeon]